MTISMMMLFPKALALSLLLTLEGVKAHGYLKFPRSHNFVASQDGAETGTASTPAKEYWYVLEVERRFTLPRFVL